MLKNSVLIGFIVGLGLTAACQKGNETTSTNKQAAQTTANSEVKQPAAAQPNQVTQTPQAAQTAPSITPAPETKPAESKPAGPAPKIVFTETEHKFGEVMEGNLAKHIFHFKNEGPGDLIIDSVKPSCGCTAKEIKLIQGDAEQEYNIGEAIPAGAEGYIAAILNTTGYKGAKASSVTVRSNDPENQIVTLKVEAEVKRLFEVEPAVVHKTNVVSKVGDEMTVTISALEGKEFVLEEIPDLPEGLGVEIIRPNGETMHQAQVKIMFKPGIKEGVFNHRLELNAVTADSDQKHKITIPITATILGPLQIIPGHAGFGLIRLGFEKEIKLTVTNRDPEHELKIEKVEVDSEQAAHIKTEVIPDLEGQTYSIKVTIDKECPVGMVKGTLKVHTNNQEMPVKEIVLNGVVR